jgi:hypothetical protein
MEPGIPDFHSIETMEGMYNLDPTVKFWATPPIHGCLRTNVVHPASLTFKIPSNVSLEEGALAEPVSIGVYSAKVAEIEPADIAVVIGAGTIGLVTALAKHRNWNWLKNSMAISLSVSIPARKIYSQLFMPSLQGESIFFSKPVGLPVY